MDAAEKQHHEELSEKEAAYQALVDEIKASFETEIKQLKSTIAKKATIAIEKKNREDIMQD